MERMRTRCVSADTHDLMVLLPPDLSLETRRHGRALPSRARHQTSSSPQLGWLAPQAASVVPIVPAPATAASPDVQQLAFGLAAVRQSVDQLAAQLEAGQRQVGGDIAKLQADEQEILHKLSVTPPRPTAAPAHKPASVTPPLAPSAQAR